MKHIAQFFTLYWCIYFPTCIAYNDLPGFSYIDEVMTIILIAYTFMHYSNKRITNHRPWKEYILFLEILAFFTVYGLVFGANVANGVWLDFIQEIRPFSVIYCTWILNPQFTNKQKRIMLITMLLTLFSWIFYHPESLTDMAVEFPTLGQLAISIGMSWYLFTTENRKNKYISLAIVLTGLLAPKYKFLGEVVCFIFLFFILKYRLNFKSWKTGGYLLIMLSVIIIITWSKFDAYYVSGINNEQLARPMTYKTAFGKIIWDYFPFGPGMGSFACNGAWKYYSPLYLKYGLNHIWGMTSSKGGGSFICDSFYPSLVQFGVVGIFLFCMFWKRRLQAFNKIQDMKYYRVAWMAFLCLAIEQVADSSWLSGKGMGYCMLIALCLNANRNMGLKDNGESLENQSNVIVS